MILWFILARPPFFAPMLEESCALCFDWSRLCLISSWPCAFVMRYHLGMIMGLHHVMVMMIIDTFYVWLGTWVCYEIPWVIISESWVTTHHLLCSNLNFYFSFDGIALHLLICWVLYKTLTVSVSRGLIIGADAPFRHNDPSHKQRLIELAHWLPSPESAEQQNTYTDASS